MTMPHRWSHLVRHGLLGGSLLAAAAPPAHAETCGNYGASSPVIGLTIGLDFLPRPALIGGVEARLCLTDNSEAMLRLEHGGGGTRIIGAARIRPFGAEEDHRADGMKEAFGVEVGFAFGRGGSEGVHVAAGLGRTYLYAAVQALFPLTSVDPLATTRVSVVGGMAPLSQPSSVVDGRPITVYGRIVAPAVLAQLAAPRSAEDRAVRDHFTRSARYEYSSVWTFLRLAAELHAVGAPAALIAAALDAADDEVRHAELCATIAGGLRLAPLAAIAAQPRFTARSPSALALLAAEAWSEGCLNEGAAAEEARLVSREAVGPVGAMLATIARDEAGHAALAWAVLAWVHATDASIVRDAIERVPRVHFAPTDDDDDDDALARRGVASPAITAAAHAQASSAATAQLRALLG